MPTQPYTVTLEHVSARPIAAVRAHIPIAEVAGHFREYLDQVYAAAKTGAITLDGQNIFVYRNGDQPKADVEFGVGTTGAFAPVGNVVPSQTPSGRAAKTVHRGDYSGLMAAHAAVRAWCREHGHTLLGECWEVYGHWHDNPEQVTTEVFYRV